MVTAREMSLRLQRHGVNLGAWGSNALLGALRAAQDEYPSVARRQTLWDLARRLADQAGTRVQVTAAQEPLPDVMDEKQFVAMLQSIDRAYAVEILKEAARIIGHQLVPLK